MKENLPLSITREGNKLRTLVKKPYVLSV